VHEGVTEVQVGAHPVRRGGAERGGRAVAGAVKLDAGRLPAAIERPNVRESVAPGGVHVAETPIGSVVDVIGVACVRGAFADGAASAALLEIDGQRVDGMYLGELGAIEIISVGKRVG